LLELLLQHGDKLRRLSPDSEATRRVQNLVEERRNLVDEKTAQINRLTHPLKIYFPQILEWFEQLDPELVCALLERWPTLEELQKVPPERLRTFFRKQRCRYPELMERRLVGIRQAIPAIRDRAVIEAKSVVVKVNAQVIRSLVGGLRIWTARSRRRRQRILIFSSLNRSPERDQCWHHACGQRSGGNGTPAPRKYKPTVESRR